MNLQHQQIHTLYEELKLPALQSHWSALAQRTADTQGSFADFLPAALQGEQAARMERTRQALLRIATLPTIKSLEAYDFDFASGAPKAQIQELASLSFIERAENIVLLGPSGSGKSFLAQGLAQHACRSGYAAQYLRLPALLNHFVQARAQGTCERLLKRLAKIAVLVIDDLGLPRMSDREKQDLREAIEERYGCGATVLTAQFPVSDWHDYLGGGRLGDAILDRLVHNAHRIELRSQESRASGTPTITRRVSRPGTGHVSDSISVSTCALKFVAPKLLEP
jgi:DNA replication protein DnaC